MVASMRPSLLVFGVDTWIQLSLVQSLDLLIFSLNTVIELWVTYHPETVSGAVMEGHRGIGSLPEMLKNCM